MTEKNMKEWFLKVPWGKLAMVSWGNPKNPGVLMIHGFVDSAATFVPLVDAMPDTYYYVTFDLPGHGRSDPLPGPPISYLHFVEAVRQIVQHMHWKSFYCIAHSMGYLISAFYNAAYPRRIRRLVVLAGVIGIGFHALTDMPKQWFEITHANYYQRYLPPSPPSASVTYDEAVTALAKARGVSNELGAVLATRCLETTSDGTVRYTWDAKAKKIFALLVSEDILLSVISIPTPTLCLVPSEDPTPVPFPEYTAKILENLRNKEYELIDVPGGHNMHMSNPKLVANHVVGFFKEDGVRAKL